mgnify:CR=1 FL=1
MKLDMRTVLVLVLIVFMLGLGLGKLSEAQSTTVTLVPEAYVKAASYIIINDGGTFKVMSGTTGAVLSSSSDALTILKYVSDRTTSGGIVYVAPGTYTLSAKWVISNPGYWKSDGAIIKLADNVDDDMINIETNDLTFEGFIFDGNGANQAGGMGIVLGKTGDIYRVTFIDCEFRNFYSYALRGYYKANGLKVIRCRFYNNLHNGDACDLLISGNSSQYTTIVEDCEFQNSSIHAIYVANGAKNVLIKGCRFYNVGSSYLHHAVYVSGDTVGCFNIKIKDCYSYNTAGAAYQLLGVNGGIVEGCTSEQDYRLVVCFPGTSYGLFNIKIVDNTVKNATQNAIVISIDKDQPNRNFIIRGNIIEEPGNDGIAVGSSYSSNPLKYVFIEENIIVKSASTNFGIHVTGYGSDIYIHRNHISGFSSPYSVESGIDISGLAYTFRQTGSSKTVTETSWTIKDYKYTDDPYLSMIPTRVYVDYDNPSGSTVTLYFRVRITYWDLTESITNTVTVTEGNSGTYIWEADDLSAYMNAGKSVKRVAVEAYVSATPAAGYEPTVTVNFYGYQL